MKSRIEVAALAIGFIAMALASQPAAAQVECVQQLPVMRPIQLGVSGGNINNVNNVECEGGTLGALVQNKSGQQFILSNNHVLAMVNRARKGQLIVQPGLLDTRCQQIQNDSVATFTRAVPLKFGKADVNIVDAAIAEVSPGMVSATILNIGGIAGTVVVPAVGMSVQKMGRTTCLTTGTISALHVNLPIAMGPGLVARFNDQVMIRVRNFCFGGDSGSLIVTQESCPRPVALLFAGAKDDSLTLANPIGRVLRQLSPKPGEFSFVGSCSPSTAAAAVQPNDLDGGLGLAKADVDAAAAVRDRHERELMRVPGALGTGIGASDEPGHPTVEVYVSRLTPQVDAVTPEAVEDVPVKLIEISPVVAY